MSAAGTPSRAAGRRTTAARLARVRESGTVRVSDAVQTLRRAGKDIVSWSVGEPDFDTPAPIREAAKRALDAGHTHYTSAWGIPELRQAIAEKSANENHIPAEAGNVLVSPAKQCIFYAILGLIDEGDEVLIPDPAWVSYEPIIALAGGRPVRVPTTREGDWRMRPDAIAERVTSKTKMLIANSPSNPTGGVATKEDVRGWADLAKDHDLWLLSDELYEKVLYEGEHVSPASLPGMMERTLTVNGLSKSFAMTGWRLGWLVADKPVLSQLIKLQQHSITHSATFNQYAAVEALRMDGSSVKAMVSEFRARRDLLVKGLRAIEGFETNVPKGAFYVFPKYRWAMDSLAFAEHLLYQGGVAVTPGSEFGPAGEQHIRISYATSRENLQKGLERVAEAVKKLGP
ncbi:MAG: pyridoxal phosphate-dependent aminotransferase [Thermoplasmatota archaeon]